MGAENLDRGGGASKRCGWSGNTIPASVYKRQPTLREAIAGIEIETQFGRVCAKLGIRIVAASSPQAKGRVERHHSTHHDRLIKKTRLEGIADYEAANRYLDEQYLAEHNVKFAWEPAADHPWRRYPAVEKRAVEKKGRAVETTAE